MNLTVETVPAHSPLRHYPNDIPQKYQTLLLDHKYPLDKI
jgi:hypothetical protein